MLDEMVSNILKPILALNSILLRKQSNIHIAKFNGHKTPRFSTKLEKNNPIFVGFTTLEYLITMQHHLNFNSYDLKRRTI